MRSCIFQLRRHQTHSTFPLSQAEFAFYFYPFALAPVILSLVPFLAFLGSSQSRAGQPDPPLFAVAEILAVSVDFVCQNTTGVVSLTSVEIFNHFLELRCFVVGVKRMIFQSRPAVCDTDIQLHAKLHGFAGLSPHNRAHKGLADGKCSITTCL